jgi:2OG-Fe(II) oxygenase superfamily
MAAALSDRVHLRANFLPPAALLQVLAACDRLGPSWTDSRTLRLVGRGGTSQVRPDDIAALGALGELRQVLGPAVLRAAQSCGFGFAAPPTLQIFPVRMAGSDTEPAYQQPHVDSHGPDRGAPVCTNVFYARVRDVVGGDLVVARSGGAAFEDAPIVVAPKANTLATFPGDRVHAVRPLRAGERLSVVVNLY